MAFFVHAVEESDGRWTCHHGLDPVDPSIGHHPNIEDALAHLRELAQTIEGAVQLVVHFADGVVERFDA